MEEILRTLNRKCAAGGWKILTFIDNAPSHPELFIDCFSHVKIVFLPKNTTSRCGSNKEFQGILPQTTATACTGQD